MFDLYVTKILTTTSKENTKMLNKHSPTSPLHSRLPHQG